MKKQSCILIQANGNNSRLGNFFKQPKHELFFGQKRIIERIIDECRETDLDIFICLRKGVSLNFNPEGCKIIECEQTFNRIDTLDQCFKYFKDYHSILILDSDVIIKSEVLKHLKGNSIAVGSYHFDDKKYGFIEVDPSFNYISGNEKEKETNHITVGAYSVLYSTFLEYLNTKKNRNNESLLNYFNINKPESLIFSDSHVVLGDIESYMNELNKK